MRFLQLMITCWLFDTGAACETPGVSVQSQFGWRDVDPIAADYLSSAKIISSATEIKPKPTTECLPPALVQATFIVDCYD